MVALIHLRWLARRIERASTDMMAAKDARIKRTGELLQGIRTIKAAAWEPAFVARVRIVLLAMFVRYEGSTLCSCRSRLCAV